MSGYAQGLAVTAPAPRVPAVATATDRDWRAGLPALGCQRLVLRELRLTDAPALLAMLGSEEVARFISPPPSSVEGFERFIHWTHRQREAGAYVCFVVVPGGRDFPAGLVQVRQLDAGWHTAEWGFALGSPFWGKGLFAEAAASVIDFVFTHLGVRRLEARAATDNGRGNGALAKLGAVREGLLRRSFMKDGKYQDQALWAIVREDWMQRQAVWSTSVH
jgi:ribosomal-protein-alanine N-acetyltransferase